MTRVVGWGKLGASIAFHRGPFFLQLWVSGAEGSWKFWMEAFQKHKGDVIDWMSGRKTHGKNILGRKNACVLKL